MFDGRMGALAMVVVLVGCGDEGDDDSAAPPTDDTAAPDLCAAEAGSSTVVPETQRNDTYPAPAGGTVVDGTYDLTRFEVFAPATADDNTRVSRLIVDGDTLKMIDTDDGKILGGTFVVSGETLQISVTCPEVSTIPMPFTAAGDELWLHDVTEPNLQVYVKQ